MAERSGTRMDGREVAEFQRGLEGQVLLPGEDGHLNHNIRPAGASQGGAAAGEAAPAR
jgi:hypothetical protein